MPPGWRVTFLCEDQHPVSGAPLAASPSHQQQAQACGPPLVACVSRLFPHQCPGPRPPAAPSPALQVDGCTQEVGGHKDYHARYKICETHLKAAVVQKDGLPNRFCQQCGKFQPVEDFDGDKRSCRARLDKHNARRRRQREMATMLRKTGTVDEKVGGWVLGRWVCRWLAGGRRGSLNRSN